MNQAIGLHLSISRRPLRQGPGRATVRNSGCIRRSIWKSLGPRSVAGWSVRFGAAHRGDVGGHPPDCVDHPGNRDNEPGKCGKFPRRSSLGCAGCLTDPGNRFTDPGDRLTDPGDCDKLPGRLSTGCTGCLTDPGDCPIDPEDCLIGPENRFIGPGDRGKLPTCFSNGRRIRLANPGDRDKLPGLLSNACGG